MAIAINSKDNIFNRYFWLISAGFLLIEIFSGIAFFVPVLGSFFCCLVFFAIFTATLKKIEWGLSAVLAELIIGGLGNLFSCHFFGLSISLRLVIFIAVMSAWLARVIYERDFKGLKSVYAYLSIPLFLCLLSALALSLIAGRPLRGIFLDGNNYLFFLLIFPVLYSRLSRDWIIRILFAGSWITALKTALVLLGFSRGWVVLHDPFYKLIRDTGIGEITLISEPLFRIFFQSHFYNLIGLLFALALLFFGINGKKQRLLLAFTVWLNGFAILTSQSKTFWIALAVGMIILVGYLIMQKKYARIMKLFIFSIACLLAGHLFLNALIGDYNINLFYYRLNKGDATAGVSSRGAQIFPALAEIIKSPALGHGFNKTITYKSSDPRIKNEANPEGFYTTDALELGYLDLMLKMGILGLLSYLAFLMILLFGAYKKSTADQRLIGAVIGLVALILIHALTPYLNHPLGIGYLLLIMIPLLTQSAGRRP